MSNNSPHVTLATAAIEAYVRENRTIRVPSDTPAELLSTCAGAFVCLKQDGHLRGCIGTIEPMRDCLAEEIVANAISACSQDPRFLPVEVSDLCTLNCSVDVLSPAEIVCGPEELDVKRYGVIVECGSRRGLLLPDLEGVDTVEEQIDIARRKAFIKAGEPMTMYRFEVKRFD